MKYEIILFINLYATLFTRLTLIRKLIPKILTAYNVDTEVTKPLISSFLETFGERAKHRGLEETVKHYKCVRLCFTRWLCGEPLLQYESVVLDSSGFPKELWEWKDHLLSLEGENRSNCLRCINTLLGIGRAFKFKPKLDVSTITEPWKGTLPEVSEETHRRICKLLKIKPADCFWEEFHMSTKKGPNGPAMATSLSDIASLPQDTIRDIILIGGEKLMYSIKKVFLQSPIQNLSMTAIWQRIFKKQPKWPRKLSYFSDKEGKTRVIAILDYWSQTALRPLHNHLMKILGKLKTDCTYNQGAFSSMLPPSGPYYCFDLSAATDRMPLLLQVKVLTEVIGKERAEAWARLLTELGYENIDLPSHIKYAAGQPMGAYSSWAAMALTHHYIVQLAAQRAGLRFFWDYCLLGDDLVIAHSEVAVQYKILCSILDMPISEAKTHVSLDTFEFAKRWFHRGVEVTGYSIGGLLETWKRYSTLHEFLENQQLHGWRLSMRGRPGLISDIYNVFGRSSERPIKLYMLYYYIRNLDKLIRTYPENVWVPEREVLSNELFSYIQSTFGIPQLLSERCMFSTPSWEVVSGIIQEIKVRIVELDMERMFSTNDKISEKLNQQFLTEFPDLRRPDIYRALLRECSPAIQVMNNTLRQSIDYVNRLATNDPSLNIFELGISRYFIAEGIFSLRAAHSISLAESQMTKWFLYILRERLEKENPLLAYLGLEIHGDLKSQWYFPPLMRRREASYRKRRAERKVGTKGHRASA